MRETEPYEWDGDWSAIVSPSERKSLDDELQRELCPTHILYGIRASAIGRRWRRDDVLFVLPDGRFCSGASDMASGEQPCLA